MRSTLKEQNLPEMKIEANHFDFNLWFLEDVYTEEYLTKLGLNERQIKAVMYVKEKGKITNKEYQEINNVKKRQASIELADLLNKQIFERIGKTGKGTFYNL
jgi:ATP-dependent DNA helicase RecG